MSSTGSNSSTQERELAAATADIVVALTSHNDAGTIGTVVRALQEGLAPYRTSSTACFVLADAGSTDGTRDAARDALDGSALVEIDFESGADIREMPYHGQPGRAAALRAILETARRLDAKACAIVEAGRQPGGPEWIERLVAPVISEGLDYVSAYYTRHVDEGAITRGVAYPVFRALYGARLRQPASGEFACSARLVSHYVEQDFWELDHASVGIDLWLAVAAAVGEFRIGEAAVGRRTAARAPADLATTLTQVVGALFADLDQHADVWQRIRKSSAVPTFGTVGAIEDGGGSLNLDSLMEKYRLGYRELRDIWRAVLPPRTIVELRRVAEAPFERFAIDDRLWATIVYDFAFGYSFRVMPREHLLRSLTPLYTGWLASFAREMRGAALTEIEERVERLCLAFEAEKRYLISRWRWPERQ